MGLRVGKFLFIRPFLFFEILNYTLNVGKIDLMSTRARVCVCVVCECVHECCMCVIMSHNFFSIAQHTCTPKHMRNGLLIKTFCFRIFSSCHKNSVQNLNVNNNGNNNQKGKEKSMSSFIKGMCTTRSSIS